MSVDFNEEEKTFTIGTEGNNIVIDMQTACSISRMVDRYYYKQDVLSYFEERQAIYNASILDDAVLINDILDTYADLRDNLDGGDGCGSWIDCLDAAMKAHSEEIFNFLL